MSIQVDGSAIFPRLRANTSLKPSKIIGVATAEEIKKELAKDKSQTATTERCANFTVPELQRVVPGKYRDIFEQWGCCSATCTHAFMLPAWVDMFGPECFAYYRVMLRQLASAGYQIKRIHWDNGCTADQHLRKHDLGKYHSGTLQDDMTYDCCGESFSEKGGCCDASVVVPMLHAMNHSFLCQLQYGVLFRDGGARGSGENVEITNAKWKPFTAQSLSWGGHNRHLEIRALSTEHNIEREDRLHIILCEQYVLNEATASLAKRKLVEFRSSIESFAGHPVQWNDALMDQWMGILRQGAEELAKFTRRKHNGTKRSYHVLLEGFA